MPTCQKSHFAGQPTCFANPPSEDKTATPHVFSMSGLKSQENQRLLFVASPEKIGGGVLGPFVKLAFSVCVRHIVRLVEVGRFGGTYSFGTSTTILSTTIPNTDLQFYRYHFSKAP